MAFQVIFEGLKEDSPEKREFVKSKLIEKFKVPNDKAERMIASAPIVVKKGLTQDQANKYKSALESIGAIATINLIADETDHIKESAPIPVEQAPIAAKSVSNVSNEAPQPSPKVEEVSPEIVKISESKPLPPLFGEVENSAPKQNALDSDYPVFYEAKEAKDESLNKKPLGKATARQTDASIDPYKTTPGLPEMTSDLKGDAATIQQPIADKPNQVKGEWWQSVKVLNPLYDEAAKSVTPISSGRVSANDYGFSIAHPTIERIPYDDVQLISTFQMGFGASPRLFIDIFISSSPRPIRLDVDLINFPSFGLTRPDDLADRISAAVTALIERNYSVVIDLATYKLLKDKTKIKIVASDREIEKYCGKLQLEVEKGLSSEANPNIITCQQANELLNSQDPWVNAPPQAFPYANQVPPTMMTPAPGMPPNQAGFNPNYPPAMSPEAYNTQPIRPANTAPGINQNPTQMAPPVRQSYPLQQPYPPAQAQPYPHNQAQPYSPNQAQPYPPNQGQYPPPSPGYSPNPMPYQQPNQPQYQPYAQPPQMAPGPRPPFAPPMPNQPNAMYQPPPFAPPVPGQLPVASPIGQTYSDATRNSEVVKAFEDAQSALIFSIVGLICTCLFPLSVVGLIKSQNALKILDKYGITENRSKATVAKVISIISLVFSAIMLLRFFMN
ncbi:MAG: hypothetical protein IPK14_06415 [Blastocatellia bacterium]|nr:hypothetical protein [Blastocatellia bacterium]MBL8193587.1 hypothetical protein [Blastocatellia bacterium]